MKQVFQCPPEMAPEAGIDTHGPGHCSGGMVALPRSPKHRPAVLVFAMSGLASTLPSRQPFIMCWTSPGKGPDGGGARFSPKRRSGPGGGSGCTEHRVHLVFTVLNLCVQHPPSPNISKGCLYWSLASFFFRGGGCRCVRVPRLQVVGIVVWRPCLQYGRTSKPPPLGCLQCGGVKGVL